MFPLTNTVFQMVQMPFFDPELAWISNISKYLLLGPGHISNLFVFGCCHGSSFWQAGNVCFPCLTFSTIENVGKRTHLFVGCPCTVTPRQDPTLSNYGCSTETLNLKPLNELIGSKTTNKIEHRQQAVFLRTLHSLIFVSLAVDFPKRQRLPSCCWRPWLRHSLESRRLVFKGWNPSNGFPTTITSQMYLNSFLHHCHLLLFNGLDRQVALPSSA